MKQLPTRNLQQDYAYGPAAVLGRGVVTYARGTPVEIVGATGDPRMRTETNHSRKQRMRPPLTSKTRFCETFRFRKCPTQANTSPFRRKDPQKSPASLRIRVRDLKDPALQCKRLVVSGYRVILKSGLYLTGVPHSRNAPPLGPYCRPMPRSLRGSYGGGRFLMGEVPL